MYATKDDFLNSLEFTTSNRTRHRIDADVSITLVCLSKPGERINFNFRNDITTLLGDGDRIVFAKFKNRLIFMKRADGYKLSQPQKTTTKNTSFMIKSDNEYLKEFLGDYEMKYDDLYEYYYIEK